MLHPSAKTCLIVGGRGYLGRELTRYLKGAGFQVLNTTRRPQSPEEIQYSLGNNFPRGSLEGIHAVVHCAYDFEPTGWKRIYRTNVEGSRNLLQQVVHAKVATLITISSLSAFDGCRSDYGRAKLLIEEATLAVGGVVLRPGLIYGDSDGGMYGRLLARVKRGRFVPLLAGSPCRQFLVHVDDLSFLISEILKGSLPRPSGPLTIANPEPWPLRRLLEAMAGDHPVKLIQVPWQLFWFGLRVAEAIGFRPAFKSDSVLSLANANPDPDFGPLIRAQVPIRPFVSDV